jgi:hypothetical protein
MLLARISDITGERSGVSWLSCREKTRPPGLLAGSEGLHPMGDATAGQFRLVFNPQLRVEFRGSTVTSDAGLLLPRELDEHPWPERPDRTTPH